MNENEYRKWDVLLKVVGVAAVSIGGIFGILEYRDTTEREFRKPFWEKQINVYFEVTKVAATIANLDDGAIEQKKAAEDDFWRLYWGQLVLVEDEKVKDAMYNFGQCLKGENEYCRSDKFRKTELQRLSLELANSCRFSIGNSWHINLDNLYIQESKAPVP